MSRRLLFAGVALGVALAGSSAWAAPASGQSTNSQAAGQSGVLVFTPDFFAEASPDTAFDMINRLPGFGLEMGDTSQRGLASASGNVLIDGARPSSKSDGLDQILRRISAATVERIELIRGGAPGIDMRGRPVVANIVLKHAVQVEKVIEANAYLYRDLYIGPLFKGQYSRRDGERQVEASLSATTDRTGGTSQGWRRRYDAGGALQQDADLDLWDHIVNVTATGGLQKPLAGGRLRLNALAKWDLHDNSQDVTILSGVGADEATREHFTSPAFELGGDWTRQTGPRTELTLTGLQRLALEDYDGRSASAGFTSDFSNRDTSGESIGRAELRFQPSARWSWESGGEAAYNFLDSKTAYSENGAAVALPNAAVKVEELRGEIFSQATWQARSSLNVEFGLRVEASTISQTGDTNKSKTFFYPKPRAQVTWTPAPGHQVRLRIQRDVGQLDFGQFVASSEINLGAVQGGNADLEPQKTTTYELVYERRFWDKGVLELLAQHTDIEDVIDVIPLAGGFDAIGNIGDGEQDKFQARLTLPLDRLGLSNARLSARGTWSHSEVVDPLTGQKREISGTAEFGCGLSFNQDLAGGRWAYGVDHGCDTDRSFRYRIRELRENVSQPFVTLYGQWKPNDRLTVRIDLGNVLDQVQYSRRELYNGPRNTAPLRYTEERSTRMGPWVFIQVRKVV